MQGSGDCLNVCLRYQKAYESPSWTGHELGMTNYFQNKHEELFAKPSSRDPFL